jgi:L-rhamnose mutarotase
MGRGGPGRGRHRSPVRRFGQVVRVRPDRIDEYERLHAAPWPGVLAAILAANIRNYSIYRHGELLFAYFEYVGEDFAADMKTMAADPVIQEWWARTDSMQEPLPERAPGDWWLTIPEIFHTD